MKKNHRCVLIACFLLASLCFASCDDLEGLREREQIGGAEPVLSGQTESETGENSEAAESQEPSHTHTPAEAVKEGELEPTCEQGGWYYELVYCAECGEELSRVRRNTSKLPHQYRDGKCVTCGMAKPSEGLVFQSNGDGTCSILEIGSCRDSVLQIPTTSPSGDRVTAIAPFAFADCTFLQRVIIPSSVKTIGVGAFRNCWESLTGVKFESPNGWNCYEGSIWQAGVLELNNEGTNALYLDIRFGDYTWKQD